jgi:hypothetical protein
MHPPVHLWQVANTRAALQSLTQLQHLAVTEVGIIAPVLDVLTSLRHLDLSEAQFRADDDYRVCTALGSLVNLTSLWFCRCRYWWAQFEGKYWVHAGF